MGTREVYEQKLRSGNLVYDPTMNPGLGNPRCPRSLSIIDPKSEFRDWSIIRDATVVDLADCVVLFINLILIPPMLLFSAASAALGGCRFCLDFDRREWPCSASVTA